jgi:hypothetical protein
MCEDFPLYTFNDEIVSYMGIMCTKTDLYKDISLSKDIHDTLKIIDKRFTFTINDNKIIYDFINFTLEINLISYKLSYHTICNVKDFIKNFNIMLVSLDMYNTKYYKYKHSIIDSVFIISSYNKMNCNPIYISYDIHQNIEILMDFLSQNFVGPIVDYGSLKYTYMDNIIKIGLVKISINNKSFSNVFEAIDYIKLIIPELFEQKIAQ